MTDAPDTAALALDRLRWEAENNFDGTCHTITQDTLELAAAALTDALAEVDRLKRVIAWANNSLHGSHGFFLSLNGGEPDEHHLDSAIEKLKEYGRKEYNRATAAEAENERLTRAWEVKHASMVKQSADEREYYDKSQARMHELMARAAAAEAKLADAMDMLKRSQDDLADMDRECAGTQAKLAEAEAALQRISNMCPATCDMSVAHCMAEEADAALGACHD